jgi:hypothetical protein
MNRTPTFRLLPWGLALACLALSPVASAVTYTVDVQPTLNDLPIKIEPVPFEGRLVMRLTNSGTVRVRCELRYDPSPQPIRRSNVFIRPGQTVENSLRATRKWFRVTVAVTCTPADG